MKTIRSQSFGVAIAAMVVVMLTSCSLVNPHITWKPPKFDKPEEKLTLDYGIRYAENAKAAYKEGLGYQSYLTSYLGIGLIPMAAGALVLGMIGGSSRDIVWLGMGAATGYAIGTWLYNKSYQRAWVAGYNATTCAVDAILPLMYVEKNKVDIKEKVKALGDAIKPIGDAIGNTRVAITTSKDDDLKRIAEQLVTEAEKLLSGSRNTHSAAEKMLQDTATAGESLKQTVDKISGQVSQQIVENAVDIQALGSMIGGLAQSYGQFVNVPESVRLAPPPSKESMKSEDLLFKAINDLRLKMTTLQDAANIVADIVNGVTASKPMDTLKACGAKVEQIAQPLTVDPSGAIELQGGKAATVGRVIKGGSAPYAVVLQGDGEGPIVRQTEAFGPAFTVQITANTLAKEYSIYISEKSGQRLFVPVVVKTATTDQTSKGESLKKAAADLNSSQPTVNLETPAVTVKIVKTEAVSGHLEMDVEVKAKSGETKPEMLQQINDPQLIAEILKLQPLTDNKIQKEDVKIRKKTPSPK